MLVLIVSNKVYSSAQRRRPEGAMSIRQFRASFILCLSVRQVDFVLLSINGSASRINFFLISRDHFVSSITIGG